MAATLFRPVRLVRPGRRQLFASRRFASSASAVPLAFDLHEPKTPVTDGQSSPILFLHGLFGSKKNNRGMSKYASGQETRPMAGFVADHALELSPVTWADLCTRWYACRPRSRARMFPFFKIPDGKPRTSGIMATRRTTPAMTTRPWPRTWPGFSTSTVFGTRLSSAIPCRSPPLPSAENSTSFLIGRH